MIVCPGCGRPAPDGTWPTVTMAADAQRSEPVAWWCPACLARRLELAHGTGCRCAGCPTEEVTA